MEVARRGRIFQRPPAVLSWYPRRAARTGDARHPPRPPHPRSVPHFASRPAALLATLLLAGCGESTGPGAATTLSLTGPVATVFELGSYEDGTPRVECSRQIVAAAHGSRTVALDSARVHWYTLAGTIEMGSDLISAADLADLFAGGRVDPKTEGVMTQVRLFAPRPFRIRFDVFYHPDGGRPDHASYTTACGVAPTGEQAGVGPKVTATSIVPVGGGSADALQPGDLIDVTYSVTAPAGVTTVQFRWDGSRAEPLVSHGRWATSLSGTVRMRVPALAELGVPTALRIIVADDEERSASTAFPAVQLTDRRNPTGQAGLAAAYQVGDALALDIQASDNDELQSVVVRWGAPLNLVDSIPFEDSIAVVQWRRTVPADWARSAPTLSVKAYDKAGNSTELTPGRVVSFYTTTTRPTRMVSWGSQGYTSGTAIDTKRGLVYFTMGSSPRLRVFSLSDGAELAAVTLPAVPRGLELTPGGDSLLFGLPDRGTLGVVDLARGNALTELPLLEFESGHRWHVQHMTLVAPDRVLAVASQEGSNLAAELIEVDLATGAQRKRGEAQGFSFPFMPMARAGDRSAAFIQATAASGGCVQRYDATTDSFGSCVHITDSMNRPSADDAGRLLLSDRFVYDATTLGIVGSIVLPNRWGESVIAPDGVVSYVGAYMGYFVVRTSDGAVLEKVALPSIPEQASLSPDGRTLVFVSPSYGTLSGGNLVIVDLAAASPVVAHTAVAPPRPSGAVVTRGHAPARRGALPPNESPAAPPAGWRAGLERAPLARAPR